jgi:hypothetical protein
MAFAFRRCSRVSMPHSVRVRAHLSTPTTTLAARMTYTLSGQPPVVPAFTCISMQISARNRRQAASFDADVRFHLHLSAKGSAAAGSRRCLGTRFRPGLSTRTSAGTHVLSASPSPCDESSLAGPRCLDRSASLDAHDPSALPCSRSRTFSHLPTDRTSFPRPIFRFVQGWWPVLGTHVHARVRFPPLGANEHTHCARSYSAYCHRESLALSSPKEPPCSSF